VLLIAEGKPNAGNRRALFRKHEDRDVHVTNIRRKLGVGTRV
jgi:hypothetical protein